MSSNSARYVAPLEETPLQAIDSVDETSKARSSWRDAWEAMRRRPMFWVSGILILLIAVVAIVPNLLTSVDPSFCQLSDSNGPSSAGHIFGFDRQGCDLFSRVIHGARASLMVGILATVVVTIVGVVIGAIAGYYGGWLDAVVSRLGDIFFAIPTVLGAIVLMSVLPNRDPLTVSLVLALFAWPQVARIMRGSVLTARAADYVTASTALGVSKLHILVRHVVPNAIPPVIIIATTMLGTFIVAEATLSFLGVGLDGFVSWGQDISKARPNLTTAPMALFWPAAALSITVLSFLLMGDVVRDALDTKARARR